MTKDVMDAIRDRKSIRRFKDEAINESTLGRVIEAALYAPSAGNIQPWQFYIVHNKDVKNKLVEASFNQTSVGIAPVVIVVGANTKMSSAKYGERGETLYCIQDTACAIQNMLLAATAFDLGTVWVGAFDEVKVKNILELPGEIRPVAIIPIGFSEIDDATENPKRAFDEVVKVIN